MAAAAAYRVEEEQLWKCPKHPTKRRRHGVCPTCLRDRLITLCPNCGNVRPCPCSSAHGHGHNSSASSSSSSYGGGGGDGEPSFNRSRSLAIPFFLRSNPSRVHTASFLSVFKRGKGKNKRGGGGDDKIDDCESNDKIDDFARMISRSRSVGVGAAAAREEGSPTAAGKGKFWNLKAFRNSKSFKSGGGEQASSNKG